MDLKLAFEGTKYTFTGTVRTSVFVQIMVLLIRKGLIEKVFNCFHDALRNRFVAVHHATCTFPLWFPREVHIFIHNKGSNSVCIIYSYYRAVRNLMSVLSNIYSMS